MYQVPVGIELTLPTVAVRVAWPPASAVRLGSAWITAPWLAQLPRWMWTACELEGLSPVTSSTTVSAPPRMASCAVPEALWSGLLGGLAGGGPSRSGTATWAPLAGLGTSPQTIGSNCASGVRLGPLWTLTYQAASGMPPSLIAVIAVTVSATPWPSAWTSCSGYATGPWRAQRPEWMWAGWTLLGARPVRRSSTVSVLVAAP